VIEDNYFETFDRPVLFAKSIDGFLYPRAPTQQRLQHPVVSGLRKYARSVRCAPKMRGRLRQ